MTSAADLLFFSRNDDVHLEKLDQAWTALIDAHGEYIRTQLHVSVMDGMFGPFVGTRPGATPGGWTAD